MSIAIQDTWTELVTEGREAVQTEEGAQWTLGRLAEAAAPREENGGLRQYAEEIGKPYSTLKAYRATYLAFPDPDSRRSGLGYEAHRNLVAVPEPKRETVLVKALEVTHEENPLAVVPSKRAIAKAAKPYKPKPPREKKEKDMDLRALSLLREMLEMAEALEAGVPDMSGEEEMVRMALVGVDSLNKKLRRFAEAISYGGDLEEQFAELLTNG